MNTILVWVLVISSNSYAGFYTQLGPYADVESCQRVSRNVTIQTHAAKKTCVQVSIPAK
jgi:hypothetical protein